MRVRLPLKDALQIAGYMLYAGIMTLIRIPIYCVTKPVKKVIDYFKEK
jgi:hypothetical protein